MFTNNQNTDDQANNVMQMLLNQVQTLQNQVSQLSSKQNQEVPVQPMPNQPNMDLQSVMSARLQGFSNVPAYGASNLSGEGILQGIGSSPMDGGSKCIWVAGIPEDFRNTQVMCNIMGNFGNVIKVKFSKKKPDGALIEMQTSDWAANCCKFLNRVELPGGRLSVKPSRIESVTITPYDDEDQGKDFSKGYSHRYRDTDSKFTQIVMSRLSTPTPVVIISAIPDDQFAEVKAYLIESGYNVENFVEGKKKASAGEGDKKRSNGFANVEFSSVEEAMSAVGKLHSTRPSSVKGLSRRGLVFSFTSRNSC